MSDVTLLRYADLCQQTYLTAPEAAAYLRYRTVKAFRSWARRHNVVPCRDGRRVTWLRVDLDHRLQRNRRVVLRALSSGKAASA